MSYARREGTASVYYNNICNSIKVSPKINGYSICAVEYLLRTLLSFDPPKNISKQKKHIDYVQFLQINDPVDYWNLTTKKSRPRKALQDAARNVFNNLKKNDQQNYMTINKKRFQISSIGIGIRFFKKNFPDAKFYEHKFNFYNVYTALHRFGKVSFRYDNNQKIVFEIKKEK